MNEEIILNMAKPYVKDGMLSYSLFDNIYSMLSLKEQYRVCEILNGNGIQLEDDVDEAADSDDSTEIILDADEQKDGFEVLYDKGIFKGANDTTTQPYSYDFSSVKQSNETLCYLVQKGNEQARQDICLKNKNLIYKYANSYYRYFGNDLEFDDLMQVGYLGLLTAAEKFDIKRDRAFSTYAVYWIKQAISREIMDHGFRIRIPVHMMERIAKASRFDRIYAADGLDYSARIEQIADAMGTSVDDVETLLSMKHQFLSSTSLDTPVGEENDSVLGDFIEADESYDIEAQIVQKDLTETIEKLLKTLPQREAKVLRMRCGIEDGRVHTLEEVGKEYNVTRERIRQIEAKALRRMRHSSRKGKLLSYWEN